MGRAWSTNGKKRNILLVGKPEGKIALEKPRRRWVDNIKMDLGDIVLSGMDWVVWRALVKAVMNLRAP
jgi:hypothetical protein